MKFSIIMPCYNSSKTLIDSINSVLNQSYKNIELIVVDDGSTDNSLDILNDIQDERMKVFKQKNKGPGCARNFGINKSTGDYILFCDSDDLLSIDIIENINKIKNFPKYDAILFKTQKVSTNGNILVNNDFESFDLSDNDKIGFIQAIYNKFSKYNDFFGFDGVCGKVIKKSFLKLNNIYFPEGIYRFEDAFFCKLLFEKSNNIRYENVLGYYYIQNPNSICHKYKENAIAIYINALNAIYDSKYDVYFNIKCLTTITECEVLYFYNKKYKKHYWSYRKEFLNILSISLFKNSIRNVDFRKIPLHYKIETILLKYRLIFLYMLMKKSYLLLKKSI